MKRASPWRKLAYRRLICVLTSVILVTNTVAPAVAATLQNRHRTVLKPGPKVPVMTGVPHMDLSMQGTPGGRPHAPEITKLDEQAKLTRPVTTSEAAAWRAASLKPGKSRMKADALIWLGEYALAGREEPAEAANVISPRRSKLRQ